MSRGQKVHLKGVGPTKTSFRGPGHHAINSPKLPDEGTTKPKPKPKTKVKREIALPTSPGWKAKTLKAVNKWLKSLETPKIVKPKVVKPKSKVTPKPKNTEPEEKSFWFPNPFKRK